MTLRPLMLALALSLGACAQADAPTDRDSADAANAAPVLEAAPDGKPRAGVAVLEGRIDFALSGRTLERNSAGDPGSVQCQLDAKASNSSRALVKSVIAEFHISRADDGSVVDSAHTLVMPFEIPPGESRDAWGPLVIDNHRCEDLALVIQAPKAGMCRTKDKGPCPAYSLAGEGVASAR